MPHNLEIGDKVGLFHSYGQERSVYFGLAEYIGTKEIVDIDHYMSLAQAGKFDAKHIPLTSGAITLGPGEQLAFRLVLTGEVIYEQEAWYAPEQLLNKLLDNIIKMNMT